MSFSCLRKFSSFPGGKGRWCGVDAGGRRRGGGGATRRASAASEPRGALAATRRLPRRQTLPAHPCRLLTPSSSRDGAVQRGMQRDGRAAGDACRRQVPGGRRGDDGGPVGPGLPPHSVQGRHGRGRLRPRGGRQGGQVAVPPASTTSSVTCVFCFPGPLLSLATTHPVRPSVRIIPMPVSKSPRAMGL